MIVYGVNVLRAVIQIKLQINQRGKNLRNYKQYLNYLSHLLDHFSAHFKYRFELFFELIKSEAIIKEQLAQQHQKFSWQKKNSDKFLVQNPYFTWTIHRTMQMAIVLFITIYFAQTVALSNNIIAPLCTAQFFIILNHILIQLYNLLKMIMIKMKMIKMIIIKINLLKCYQRK